MKQPPLSLGGLVVIAALSLAGLFAADHLLTYERLRPDAVLMRNAVRRSEQWFRCVKDLKEERGLWNASMDVSGYRWMLGDPYSQITTTLGSLESKETACNPAFAALAVRLLHDAGVDSGETVGLTFSGSFPTLGIATVAALETLGLHAVLVSSLGASTYGANQPEATWLDMETWLRRRCGMQTASSLVTPGAEADAGKGLPEGGWESLMKAADRCGVPLTVPGTLEEAVRLRMNLLTSRKIGVLINIGGSQPCLGTCSHAATLPTGYLPPLPACTDSGRGVIERVAERGIPVIHFLNIRDLAHRYGLPVGLSMRVTEPGAIYAERSVQRIPLVLILCGLLGILWLRKISASITGKTMPNSVALERPSAQR